MGTHEKRGPSGQLLGIHWTTWIIIFIIVGLFIFFGIRYFKSGPCFKEETCIRANIVGEWSEEDGVLDVGGCYANPYNKDIGVCVCKNNYGGPKCETEVCTADIRQNCNGGVEVPESDIGNEEFGQCATQALPDHQGRNLEPNCECMNGYATAPGSGDIKCNIKRAGTIPDMVKGEFRGCSSTGDCEKLVYNGQIVNENTCNNIDCNSSEIRSGTLRSGATSLALSHVKGRLLGEWMKRWGTGHIFINNEYATQREINIMKAVIKRNCEAGPSDPVVLPTDGIDFTEFCNNGQADPDCSKWAIETTDIQGNPNMAISSITADDITNINDKFRDTFGPMFTGLEAGEVCSYHNSAIPIPGKTGTITELNKLNTPRGKCKYENSLSDNDKIIRLVIELSDYLFIKMINNADDVTDAMMYGPLSPQDIYTKLVDSSDFSSESDWEYISLAIAENGLPVIIDGMSETRIFPMSQWVKSQLCNGCWTLHEDTLAILADDDSGPWGASPQEPITFIPNTDGCGQYTNNNHYAKWIPDEDKRDLCIGEECLENECCIPTNPPIDYCNVDVNPTARTSDPPKVDNMPFDNGFGCDLEYDINTTALMTEVTRIRERNSG